jgi:hypothetical protein
VLLELLAEHLQALAGLSLLVLALDHHLDLEEDGVVGDAVEAEHVAALGDAVLGEDGRDGLEDGVDVEVAVGGLRLPVGDELLADLEGLVVQLDLVLVRDGEDDVAVTVSCLGSRQLSWRGLTGSRRQSRARQRGSCGW